MFLTNLSKREKTLCYITPAIIIASLGGNFLFKPLLEKWQALNSEILRREIKLKQNIKYLNQQETIKQVYSDYEGYIKRSGSDEEEIAVLLNAVEQEARAAHIHIANIRPKPVQDFKFYKKYLIEMSCESTAADYTAFIYRLHQSARQIIRVERLKLVSQGEANPLIKAQLLITEILSVP